MGLIYKEEMMKKIVIFGLTTITLLLGACDNKIDTPEEILDAALDAAEEAKSYRSVMKIEQEVALFSEPVKQETELTMDYVKGPGGIHVTQKTTAAGTNGGEAERVSQLYFVDGTPYSSNSEHDDWWRGKETGPHPSLDEAMEYTNLVHRLKAIQEHTNELELEEKENYYLLTLKGSGDSFHDLSVYFYDVSAPAYEDVDYGENLQNNGFTYTLQISKDNFLLTNSSIQADLEIDRIDPGDHLKTKTSINETISKYDELKPIKLPDEVLNNSYDNSTGEKIN
jgi:hypothetical protein